jgi:hypothetical protein
VKVDVSGLTLEAVEQSDVATLRCLWSDTKGTAPPQAFTVRLALAWEVQVASQFGENARTKRAWRRIIRCRSGHGQNNEARARLPTSVAGGTRILKNWGGATYEVLVTRDGDVNWNGRSYTSLSAVARAMTGTNRNGPKFFGLREGAKR